ncbi:hypothetical protein F5148DRAFT_1146101 [Russula earlei]|uniref:Uncharacterized protein n=1 Tax=Russula earlei TaxID=71964 RepID=A0ACC0UL78_9AGAM|nr:hypothetical protein F5148DRAFT_1146101 [Russula earlei]
MSSASTPTVTPSDPTSPITSGPTQSGNGNGGPSSSLYLHARRRDGGDGGGERGRGKGFTFLATLFLLLFVSSAIILRSFILRRRFRRRVEEAILAGVIPPTTRHGGRASRRRAIGQKPKLWEARVSPASNDTWGAIVPVSVLPVTGTPTAAPGQDAQAMDANGGEMQAAAPVVAHDPPRPLHRRLWLRNPFSRRAPPSPLATPPSRVGACLVRRLASSRRRPPPVAERVTVLIAMPDPRRPHPNGTAFAGHHHPKGKEKKSFDLDYDEDDLPEMVLGMTELHCNDAVTTPRSSSP